MIKLHSKYLLNKTNIKIMGLLIVASVIISIILIAPFEKESVKWMMRYINNVNYKETFKTFDNIIIVILSIYLFGMYFSYENDNYAIILRGFVKVEKYFFTKVLTIFIMIFIINFIMILFNTLIGYIFSKYYVININDIIDYLSIYLESINYGIISLIFIRLFKSIYVTLLPTSIYIMIKLIIEGVQKSKLLSVLLAIFPTIYTNNNILVFKHGILHMLLCLISYILIAYFIYDNKE